MKNFADTKHRMIVGQPMTIIYSKYPNHKYLNVTRKIISKRSNSVRFEGGSELRFPSARAVRIMGDDVFSIDDSDNKTLLTYIFN